MRRVLHEWGGDLKGNGIEKRWQSICVDDDSALRVCYWKYMGHEVEKGNAFWQ